MTILGNDSRKDDFDRITTHLTQLLFPFIGLMSLNAIVQGVLHQQGRFFISGLSPIFFNISCICGALVFSPLLLEHAPQWIDISFAPRSIIGLALGVLLGGVLQLVFQFAYIINL